MPNRRGGGGDDGGAGDSVLRRGLRELLDRVDRQANGGGSGGGGRRDGSGGAREASRGRDGRGRGAQRGTVASGQGSTAGASRAAQPGDWVCRGCRFTPNFAKRRTCFQCGRPRSPRGGGQATAAGGHGGAARGPVGAGGQRPLLGGRAVAGPAAAAAASRGTAGLQPSYRVPGASLAARASAGGGGDSWASVAKAAAAQGVTPPPEAGTEASQTAATAGQTGDSVDSDGFRLVRGRRGRKGDASAAAGEGAPGEGIQASDGSGGQAEGCEGTHDAEGDGGAEAEGQPSTADLHQAWLDEVALVKRLRGQGLADGHPVMRAACDSRDAAEKAWRGAKVPAPASIRLGRAQSRLDKAIALQADARKAMLDAEQAHRDRMSTLQATMDECANRVRMRRQQLREVQQEVGAGGAQVAEAQRTQQAAIRRVHETLCGDVGPTIAALVDQLDTGAPAWAALNGVLGKLAASKATLEGATERSADTFDIGEGEEPGDDDSEWSESREGLGRLGGNGGSDGGWRMWMEGQHHEADHDHPMDTDEWGDSPTRRWGGPVRWQACGHGQWARASWADQLEAEQGGQSGATEGDGQPPAARRRLEAADGDQARDSGAQQQPQQQQQQPPATQPPGSGAAGVGPADGGDPERRARRLSDRLDQIVTMAVQAGVTPLTKRGEELHTIGEARLEEWVAECLPAALLC